jgi:ribosomal protein S17
MRRTLQAGDLVRIEETRPMSKRKRWIVREIVEQGIRSNSRRERPGATL